MNLPRLFAVAALALTAVVPASASAATLGTATLGTDWFSTFTFTQAADEANGFIAVARDASLDASGGLVTYADGDTIESSATSWRPSTPLHAGDYYWQLATYGTTDSERRLTPVQRYDVPAILAKPTVTFTCTRRSQLTLVASWRTNVEDLKISYRITQGKKVVDSVRNYPIWTSNAEIGQPDSKTDRYQPFLASKFQKGAKYKVAYSITGPGIAFNRSAVATCR